MADESSKGIIEKWGAKALAVTAILSLVFLVFPKLKPREEPSGTTAPSSSEIGQEPRALVTKQAELLAGDVIIGTWMQYVIDESGEVRWLSTYAVTRLNGEYVMSAKDQAQGTDVVNSVGIFDVRSDGQTWSFNSNWGQGRIGRFVLERTSSTVFEGNVLYEGQIIGRNRWIRSP